MSIRRLFSFLCLSALSINSWADDYADLHASVARLSPDLQIMAVAETPMTGILKVVINTGETIYMSADGNYFLAGNLYQNTIEEGFLNLTEVDQQQSRKAIMQSPIAENAWVFNAAGDKKASITVFTDVDCYYCQKLHSEIAQINALGIEVRYLSFPRAGIGSSSYQVMVDAWCAEDPNTFLTTAKQRAQDGMPPLASPTACENPVADHFALSQTLALTGTPAIIIETGELWPGYLPADELARRLGIN